MAKIIAITCKTNNIINNYKMGLHFIIVVSLIKNYYYSTISKKKVKLDTLEIVLNAGNSYKYCLKKMCVYHHHIISAVGEIGN